MALAPFARGLIASLEATMKSTRLVGLTALIVSAGLSTVGCDDTSNTGGSGGAGTSSSTGKATTTSTMVTVNSSSSGMMGDGNESFETAEELDLSQGITDVSTDIFDINEDVDFFKFEGTAGQQLLIGIEAHLGDDLQSEEYIDSVVTLYDSNKTQIAFNDDPFPRLGSQDSSLFTRLPTAGTYYIKVEDFHHFDATAPAPAMLPDGAYKLTVGGFNTMVLKNDAEPNDTSATATAIDPFTKNMAAYQQKLPFGTLTGADSVDWFKFHSPADLAPDAGTRSEIFITFYPGTVDGSGSTSELASVQLVDATDNSVIAESKPASETGTKLSSTEWDAELAGPIVADHDYFLKVTRAGAGGANDFYYMQFFVDLGSNPLEKENGLVNPNNDVMLSETVTTMASGTAEQGFLAGDLDDGVVGVPDVDWFKIPTGGKTKVAAFCGAESSGSGLRGVKVTLTTSNGTPLLGMSSVTEKPDESIAIQGAMGEGLDTAGAADVFLKVEQTGTADATVTSRFYRCGVAMFDPTP